MGQDYLRLCGFENLYQAYHKTRVARFKVKLEAELWRLQDEHRNPTVTPSVSTSFYLTEAKRQSISAVPFRDRVVCHALDRCTQFLRASRIFLQCDVRLLFPINDHQILLRGLRHRIAECRVFTDRRAPKKANAPVPDWVTRSPRITWADITQPDDAAQRCGSIWRQMPVASGASKTGAINAKTQ